MIKIDSVRWGEIEINGQEFRQVLIIKDQVFERDSEKLQQLFDTSHKIGDWEVEKLVSEKPKMIVVGNGWDGLLEVNEELKAKSEKLGIILKIFRTPKAVEEYNRLIGEGKKVNALIHTTC